MDKPFHLLTPQEKTILRIAQNRAIAKKRKRQPLRCHQANLSKDYTRATPEDHLGSVIRKVKP